MEAVLSGQFKESAWLDVEDISVAYDGQPILCDVTFQVAHGARVAVVGPNGSGKSTLFKALVGLLPLLKGRVRIHGLPLGHHQDCVAYVPQREEVDWRFPVTVADVVMMGRFGRLGWLRRPTKEDGAVVTRCLEQMGIADLAHRPIGELSGGQQQRAFLARAMAQQPHVLLLDEPFTGVDIATQESILELLDQLQAQQVTMLISTHDLNLAATRFDRILLLKRRVMAYGTSAQVFTHQVLAETFGGQVLILPDGTTALDRCISEETGAKLRC